MNNKKNIALFVASIGYGGTERVVSKLANELINYYNVTLVLIYNSIDLPIHDDVNIVCISDKEEHFDNSKWLKLSNFLRSALKYRKIIKEHEIDISISFLIKQNVINGFTKMLNPSLKTIISERCFPSKTYGLFGKQLVAFFYNKNDSLFSNSLHINADLQENFNVKIPAKVIYNPIYTQDQKPDFKAFNDAKENFKVISVGRLIPIKNQESLIQSIALLDPKTTLNLYGVGPLEEELKALSSTLKLTERIHFNGNSDTINQSILENHCLALTSLSEGFPNVILEAMSLGVPVVATNCMSGPLELLNDNIEITIDKGDFYKAKYGLLVNVDDTEGLAKAISYYREHEELRKKYSDLSFKKAKQYDISEIGNQLKNLIDAHLCVE
ncbi:glycosyltransferase [Lacinutrix iliipiscaria]|uniref:Glycosyltransferase n=1 Tax=Lacinutrix iliipiscaria TaxID=1230532 RepID=A0ABW5WLJ8_9FLAO